MSIPLNTDDWAGKYKGKTPANTDVDNFSNASSLEPTRENLMKLGLDFKAYDRRKAMMQQSITQYEKELDPTNEKRLKRLAEKREKTKRKNQVLRFVSLAVLVAGGYYLATQK